MSDFLLNLARRGAGLAPVVTLQPPFRPSFTQDPGAALKLPEEPPLKSEAEIAPAVQVQPAHPLEPVASRPGKEGLPSWPLMAAERQSSTSSPSPKPTSPPAFRPHVKSDIQIPGDIPKSGHSSASSQPSVAQPLPAEPAPQTQKLESALAKRETYPVAEAITSRVIAKEVAKVRPAHPQPAGESRPVIKPAVTPSPSYPAAVQPAVTPAESRSIQVRIGTIEVRATTPPHPQQQMPTPKGFDDYSQVRNYVSWER